MVETKQATELADGVFDVATEIKRLCAACGYDLTPEEIAADTCADCGASLSVAQHVAVHATSVAAVAIAF